MRQRRLVKKDLDDDTIGAYIGRTVQMEDCIGIRKCKDVFTLNEYIED